MLFLASDIGVSLGRENPEKWKIHLEIWENRRLNWISRVETSAERLANKRAAEELMRRDRECCRDAFVKFSARLAEMRSNWVALSNKFFFMPQRLGERRRGEKIFCLRRGKYVESGKSVSARVKSCVRKRACGWMVARECCSKPTASARSGWKHLWMPSFRCSKHFASIDRLAERLSAPLT